MAQHYRIHVVHVGAMRAWCVKCPHPFAETMTTQTHDMTCTNNRPVPPHFLFNAPPSIARAVLLVRGVLGPAGPALCVTPAADLASGRVTDASSHVTQ